MVFLTRISSTLISDAATSFSLSPSSCTFSFLDIPRINDELKGEVNFLVQSLNISLPIFICQTDEIFSVPLSVCLPAASVVDGFSESSMCTVCLSCFKTDIL